ncbi:MAG: hypothetical protein HC843_10475 [Sphingomonadales bacterium]|nr:hypothetical protein [Sphingomonadales bacterium]
MRRYFAPVIAFLSVFTALPLAAKATCPADNHQQLYDMNERLIVPESRNLDAATAFIRKRMGECPDDYEALGYMAVQMGNIIRLRQDPAQIVKDIDLGFDLVAKTAVSINQTPRPFPLPLKTDSLRAFSQ